MRGATKAILLYVLVDVMISFLTGVGKALFELPAEEWNSWDSRKQWAWWMMQIGPVLASGALLFKAATSNSTKPQ